MKKCTKCKIEKILEEFHRDRKSKDGRCHSCKQCHQEASKRTYNNNKQHCLDTVRKLANIRRKEYRFNIKEYLLTHPCVDCGEKDWVVLEFDHVLGIKKAGIAQMIRFSWDKILKEIAKCEVVCANCHKKRTYSRIDCYRSV